MVVHGLHCRSCHHGDLVHVQSMNVSSYPDVVIQFDPTGYIVAEGSSTMLRVVKIGVADVTVSVSLSTMVETAGDLS